MYVKIPDDMYNGAIFETNKYGKVVVLQWINHREVEVLFINTGSTCVKNPDAVRAGKIKDTSIYKSALSPDKLVFGVGINDADYKVNPVIDGKRVMCPYYSRWLHMLRRCYSSYWIKKYPTYNGCSVCEEWLTFSNFKKWMETQDWEGKELDKDILSAKNRNKIYSPEACIFITGRLNRFLKTPQTTGEYKMGVDFIKKLGKFRSRCKDPFDDFKSIHLGCFSSEEAAHEAWKCSKITFLDKLRRCGDIPNEEIYDKIKEDILSYE